MTPLEQLRTLYFNASQGSIDEDFLTAIALFKQLTTDEDREKAAVFMEGIAEMRQEWGGGGKGSGGAGGARRRGPRDAKRGPPSRKKAR